MIDMKKQYRTRNGHEVRIYAVDGGGTYPVHGASLNDGRWIPSNWTEDSQGQAGKTSWSDLVEVKPRFKIERWVNVYMDKDEASTGQLYDSKACADASCDCGCVASVRVTIEGEAGEGLNEGEKA